MVEWSDHWTNTFLLPTVLTPKLENPEIDRQKFLIWLHRAPELCMSGGEKWP
jgi:hypothetical protein